jgi:hypothetical protein
MAIETRQLPALPVRAGRTQYQIVPERVSVPAGRGRGRFVNVHPADTDADAAGWTCSCICGWNGRGLRFRNEGAAEHAGALHMRVCRLINR